MTNTCTYLNSKPRYEILDGLRGVSAMMVVAFHLFETYSDGVPYQIINHGYLAVDFFFVLSGFVIGYAYDDRWDKMNTWSFFKRRLIRLHPMLVCGTLIGTCFFYFGGDHPDFSMINEVSVWTLLMITLVCITMYPLQQSLDIRGWGEMNPLNGATWSLFWEYLANVAYALFIRHFPKWMLALLVFGSALLTVILCLNIDVFNCLSARSYAQYTVIGGWSLTPDQLQIGVTRLLYPFFMGLLLSRVNRLISVKGAFWWCTMAVIVILAMPRVGGAAESNYWMNGVYELLCILFLFPSIVTIGAGSSTKGRTSAVNKFLGDISYPLYVTHYPLVYWQMSWSATHTDLPVETHVFVAVVVFIFALVIAYTSLKLFDLPVREWLRKKCF